MNNEIDSMPGACAVLSGLADCGKSLTHCKREHPFDQLNTGRARKTGRRYCRACKMASQQKPERKRKKSNDDRKRFQESMSGRKRDNRLQQKRDRYDRVGRGEMKEARILVAVSKVPREFAGARRALYELNSAIMKDSTPEAQTHER
jgi:hypothetical protein